MGEGVEGLLRDKTRPSGTPPVPDETVKEVVRLTHEAPPHEATHWTAQAMAKTVGLAVSQSSKLDLEGKAYDAPVGWHWATRAEVEAVLGWDRKPETHN